MPRDRAQEMVTRARSPFDLADLLTGQIELLLQLKESMDHGATPPAALLGRMINDHAQVKAHTLAQNLEESTVNTFFQEGGTAKAGGEPLWPFNTRRRASVEPIPILLA